MNVVGSASENLLSAGDDACRSLDAQAAALTYRRVNLDAHRSDGGVEDLDAAIGFFNQFGLDLEGRADIEGAWADGCTGLRDMPVEVALMRTPDGRGRLELSRFLSPRVFADHRGAPVNALGYLRVMFTVEDVDDTLARLTRHGAELVGEVVQFGDTYRLCYIRGPEGTLIALAQDLAPRPSACVRRGRSLMAGLTRPGLTRGTRQAYLQPHG